MKYSKERIHSIVQIAGKKLHMKTDQDLRELDQFLDCSYIESLKNQLSSKQYEQFLKELQYEGEIGRKFYIIIDGSVLILIPQKEPMSISDNKLSQSDPQLQQRLIIIIARELFIQNNYSNWEIIKELKGGQAFGEIALMYDQPRTATILSTQVTHLLTMRREAYKKILGKPESHHKLLVTEQMQYLKQVSLFKTWSDTSLNIIIYDMVEHDYTRGQYVFRQGDPVNSIYVVKEGELQVQLLQLLELKLTKKASNVVSLSKLSDLMLISKQLSSQLSKESLKFNHSLNIKNDQKFAKQVQIALVGQFECFGQEDTLQNLQQRTFSAVCYSQNARLFRIEKKKFLENIQSSSIILSYLKNQQTKLEKREQLTQRAVDLASDQITNSIFQIHMKPPLYDTVENQIDWNHLLVTRSNFNSPRSPLVEQTKSYKNSLDLEVTSQLLDQTKMSSNNNRPLKEILKNRVLVHSFVNYQKKRFNGQVTQEQFFQKLKEEQLQKNLRVHDFRIPQILDKKRSVSNCNPLDKDFFENHSKKNESKSSSIQQLTFRNKNIIQLNEPEKCIEQMLRNMKFKKQEKLISLKKHNFGSFKNNYYCYNP